MSFCTVSENGQIFYFQNCFLGQVGNTALCLKKYHKNEWHLCLVTYIFTKLSSQNMCLRIKYIFWYIDMPDVTVISYKKPLFIFFYFWGIFTHYWRLFMSEVVYLHQSFKDCVSKIVVLSYFNHLRLRQPESFWPFGTWSHFCNQKPLL